MQNEWRGFQRGSWEEEINVRDFIQKNYTPYDGDDSFLEGPTQDTTDLWNEVLELSKQEREAGGVLDMDTKIISTITSHGPGYLDKSKEKEMLKGLKSASGYLRRELGAALQLRYTPELQFVADDSIAQGAHILEMLRDPNVVKPANPANADIVLEEDE